MTIQSELTAKRTSECILCRYISGNRSGKTWQSYLDAPVEVVSHANVVRAMAERGVVITEASVRRHRKNHATHPLS